MTTRTQIDKTKCLQIFTLRGIFTLLIIGAKGKWGMEGILGPRGKEAEKPKRRDQEGQAGTETEVLAGFVARTRDSNDHVTQ